MEVKRIITEAEELMKKSIGHLENDLAGVRAGKVSPGLLDGITVDYYGSQMLISQVANVNATDARTLMIQPWEKKMLDLIEKAILAANLGANPYNDGNAIKIFMPPLTEERRKEFVKKAHHLAETTRVGIRNIRRDANDAIKKLGKEHVSEDIIKDAESQTQKLTDNFIAQVEKHLQQKEKEIMTV